MKLYFSPTSPYVRKCLVTAHELGVSERIELLPSNVHPVQRDREIVAVNPLGKVPTFVTDDGRVLYDSRVICEYLDAFAGGSLFPREGEQRWDALTLQALGDGILDAAILARYENVVRPEALRWQDWSDGQLDKIATSMEALESATDRLGHVHIGTLTLGCALWYLDLRFSELAWRQRFPRLARWAEEFGQRESMKATWAL